MNKKKLFKTIMITLLIFIGLTWVIKTGTYSDAGAFSEGSFAPFGIANLFLVPLQSFQTFSQYGIYLLVVGGFYGILKKTGAYDKIVSKCAGYNKTTFMVVTVILFALLSSVLGITMGLFVLVPFFKDVLETMGYDKKNAMLATIGAIFVGLIGSTLSFEVNGYINYFYKVGYNELIIYKVILLVILTLLLIVYIKKSNKNFDSKKLEVKGNVKTIPALIIAILTVLLGFVGMYSWYHAHNIAIFDDLHTAITDIKIGNFSILSNIIGQNTSALGRWSELDFSALLLISSLIISWIYGLKTKEIYEGFVDGAKELLPMAIFVSLSFVLFMPLYTSSNMQSIFYTIFNKIIGLADKVSIVPMTLLSSIGTIFYGQFIYLASDLSTPLAKAYTDSYPLMTLIMQTIYGLTSFLAPTSMLLLGGLAYFDINYKDWMKHIFKFLLIALGILIVTFLIIGWAS